MVLDSANLEGMTDHRVLALMLLLVPSVLAQNGGVIVSSGYERISTLIFAPGQVVRLRVAGYPPLAPNYHLPQNATILPLPTEMAGFSVTVSQRIGTTIGPSLAAPMISVEQQGICAELTGGFGVLPDCLLTVLTVQMPFELTPPSFDGPIQVTLVVIAHDGKNSVPFAALALADQIHVVTTCDSFRPLGSSCDFPASTVVTHANGSMVTRQSPAKPGEVVTIYAWGLGSSEPRIETGKPTPPAIIPVANDKIVAAFDFRSNAAASWRVGQAASRPEFVGLTPGQVGLYQVNVRLPSAFPAVEPCDGVVGSNLTINVAGDYSSDGAAICVAVPNEK
jgi:uncharacterized protein (TIGR03437 family)